MFDQLRTILKIKPIETIYVKGITRFNGSMRFDAPLYRATYLPNKIFLSKSDNDYIIIEPSTLYEIGYQDKTLHIELR